MVAQPIKVRPPALLQAAQSAAVTAENAAAPHPGVVPVASPGSPADGAAATISAGMSARSGQLAAKLAGKGPQVQATTQSGVAQMQGQDARNATEIEQLAKGTSQNPRPHNGIQLVDNHTFKQDPSLPPPGPGPAGGSDPLGRLNLPPYNPASLPEDEARRVYGIGKLRIIEQDEQLAKQGVSLEERARIASGSRNALRSWIREIQANRTAADWLNQHERNLTWDDVVKKYQDQGLSGDDLWRKIIEKSVDSRAAVDAEFGVDPKNPGELPPILPTAPQYPTISPPPDLPPIGQHPPVGPAPPTVFDHPPSTALPPTVLDHPPLPPWLQDPSPPGFHTTPSQPPDIFHWDMPDPAPPAPVVAPPTSAAGPPVNIHVPPVSPDQAAAGGLAAVGAFGLWVLSQLPKLAYLGRS
jgi:hypothetical protein